MTKILFGGTTVMAAIFAFLGEGGSEYFAKLLDEILALKGIEFSLGLLILSVGMMGVFAIRQTTTLFQIASKFYKFAEGFYGAACAPMVGWMLGLSIFYLAMGEIRSSLMGVLLTAQLVILLGAPLKWMRDFASGANRQTELHFGEKTYSLQLWGCYCALVILAAWSFVQAKT